MSINFIDVVLMLGIVIELCIIWYLFLTSFN